MCWAYNINPNRKYEKKDTHTITVIDKSHQRIAVTEKKEGFITSIDVRGCQAMTGPSGYL
jgi:hypothetical protein